MFAAFHRDSMASPDPIRSRDGVARVADHAVRAGVDAVLFVRFDDGGAAADVVVMEHDDGPDAWEKVRDRLGLTRPTPPRPPRPPGSLPPELG